MFANLSIRGKLLLPGMLALLAFVVAISSFWTQRYEAQLEHAFQSQIELSTTYITPPLAEGVWNFNDTMIESALLGLDSFDAFVFAQVVNDGDVVTQRVNGEEWVEGWNSLVEELLATETGTSIQSGPLMLQSVPLVVEGDDIGTLIWAFSREALEAEVAEANLLGAGIGLVSFIAFAALLFLIAGSVAKPISRLICRINELQSGNIEIEVPEAVRNDEVGQLGKALESFKVSIAETRRLEAEQKAAEDARVAAEKVAAEEQRARELEDQARQEEERKAEMRQQKREAEEQERQIAEQARITKETSIVVDGLGHALAKLSNGNMNCQIETPFPDKYEMLRADFNSTVAKLAGTVRTTLEKSEGIRGDVSSLNAASAGLAQRTERQAATLSGTAEVISHLANGSRECASLADDASSLAQTAQTNAEEGAQVVAQTVSAMNDIEEGSKRITNIISVIEDIAFQTNLLALNAGVEAARAGKVGSGFAVVASEVRSLAARSSEAASEISQIIVKNGEAVAEGTRLVDSCGESLTRIKASIDEIHVKNLEIDKMSKSQSTSINEVSASLEELGSTTQQNAAMFEETNASIAVLDNEATALAELMSFFDIDDMAASQSSRQASALRQA